MINPAWLGLFYGLSEAGISMFRRSKAGSGEADRGTLRLIWRVIGLSMMAAALAYVYVPGAHLHSVAAYWTGFAFYVSGLALRWYSIVYLGRFFTVDVAIAADHKVVDTGPYRWVRHPSYTGALLAFLGFGLCLGNVLSALLLFGPIATVFLHRVRVEEAALQSSLGAAYTRYMQHTHRLIPFVY
jgi:protein-S-isoprenylcysteine O-methyltransferase Ste14